MAPDDPPDAGDPLAVRRRMVLVSALGAVVAAGLLFALVARAMSTDTGSSAGSGGNRRPAVFDVGPAEQRAAAVARDGPFLFPDPQGRSRDIFFQHLGGKDWVAFEARARGAPRQCVLRWEPGGSRFVDPCDGRAYPPDGTGLVTFPARVDDKGRVVVDLSRPTTPPPP